MRLLTSEVVVNVELTFTHVLNEFLILFLFKALGVRQKKFLTASLDGWV